MFSQVDNRFFVDAQRMMLQPAILWRGEFDDCRQSPISAKSSCHALAYQHQPIARPAKTFPICAYFSATSIWRKHG